MNPVVADSGCLMCSPFCVTSPLGPHDVGYTLVLRMHLHWVVLETLVEDGLGVEIISRLLFGIWMAALPAL